MPFHDGWPVPCLLLAALALLACGAAASQEVANSTTMPSGQQYDNFVFTISPGIPKHRETVRLSVPQPMITGGGLTLTGWAENSAKGEYAFEYAVEGATITDSSLIITGAIPADGIVMLKNTQAVSAMPMPVFDFSAMSLTSNVSVTVQGSHVEYSGAGVDSVVVQIGRSAAPALVTDYSFLQVLGMRVSGGSCVLSMAAGSSGQSVLLVTSYAAVALDAVEADGLSRAALCVDSSLIVSLNSAARVTKSQLRTATVDGVERSPKLVIDVSSGRVTVVSGSMLVVKDVSIPDGGVLGSTAGGLVSGSANLDSIIAVIDIDAKTFCPSCTIEGFPSSRDKSSYVYAQDWTIDGSQTTDYNDHALGGATGLTEGRDSEGKCRSAYCLPVNSKPVGSSAHQCGCNCKDGSSLPMCLNTEDRSLTYQVCSDVHCVDCGTANGAGCKKCLPNYDVDANGKCVVVNCEVEHCTKCATADANICARCEAGYGLVNGKCQACGVNYCTSCDGDTSLCSACYSGFTLSADRRKCTTAVTECCVAHCAKCVDGSVNRCANCRAGYGLLSNGQCYRCADANCKTCDGDVRKCTSCNSGYTLTSASFGTCSPGGRCMVPKCAYCKAGDVNVCQVCARGYTVNPANGQCVLAGTCLAEHCLKCVMGKTDYCMICGDVSTPNLSYAPDANGVCQLITDPICKLANCHRCQYSSEGHMCEKCADGLVVTCTGKCGLDPHCVVPYCEKCHALDVRRCVRCLPSLKLRNGQCVPQHMGAPGLVPTHSLAVAAVTLFATAVAGLI